MNRIAKHILLFGLFAVLLSTVPVQAMDEEDEEEVEVVLPDDEDEQ